ncbi:MAG: hypothetical protein FD123_3394 [Bacteroidetes bacterium]|nr:MAG: hypothetical protein FD123_3394 [Bacteroidota bacterium]
MNYTLPLSSVMTTDPVTVNREQKLIDVKHIYEKQKFHHHIPVIDDEGKPVGLIDMAAFIRALGSASLDESEKVYNATTVGDIMSAQPVICDPHTTIKVAAEEFCKNRADAILVVKDSKLAGIVTPLDLVKLIAGH